MVPRETVSFVFPRVEVIYANTQRDVPLFPDITQQIKNVFTDKFSINVINRPFPEDK